MMIIYRSLIFLLLMFVGISSNAQDNSRIAHDNSTIYWENASDIGTDIRDSYYDILKNVGTFEGWTKIESAEIIFVRGQEYCVEVLGMGSGISRLVINIYLHKKKKWHLIARSKQGCFGFHDITVEYDSIQDKVFANAVAYGKIIKSDSIQKKVKLSIEDTRQYDIDFIFRRSSYLNESNSSKMDLERLRELSGVNLE